ncbi:hypothetical protein BDV36DRAFT_250011 [Aspergillus pseudocaelatus]|uniref:Uncharacterized protein n=1 Tax=Aspergillus pseudocaelatus TaxID=1825620 RepID=A0ABQ6WT79_9EURO|nr:hypothetical protein BDV36DRAFT_250011 [Aspergillus pseudocaelatus]
MDAWGTLCVIFCDYSDYSDFSFSFGGIYLVDWRGGFCGIILGSCSILSPVGRCFKEV